MLIRKLLIIFIVLLINNYCFSQILKGSTWTSRLNKVNDSIYELTIEAKIDSGWFIFSQFSPVINGYPYKTDFKFMNSKNKFYFDLNPIEMTAPTIIYDSISELNVKIFTQKAIFIRNLKFSNNSHFAFMTINYMDYAFSKVCLPPKELKYKIFYSRKIKSFVLKEIQ